MYEALARLAPIYVVVMLVLYRLALTLHEVNTHITTVRGR